MDETPPTARDAVAVDDLQTLHRLLDLVRRDVASLLVVDLVWFRERHRVVGRLADGSEAAVPFVPVVIRCGPGPRPIRVGMRLRLWRDAGRVALEHCIP